MEVLREKWKILEYRDGCIYDTKKLRSEWFELKNAPETHVVDSDGEFWVPTTEVRFPLLDKKGL